MSRVTLCNIFYAFTKNHLNILKNALSYIHLINCELVILTILVALVLIFLNKNELE